MVTAVNSNPIQRIRMVRPDTTGVLAARPTATNNIFASANVSAPTSIFGSSTGSTETSGTTASNSGGGSTLALA